jgi:hypothetical protein
MHCFAHSRAHHLFISQLRKQQRHAVISTESPTDRNCAYNTPSTQSNHPPTQVPAPGPWLPLEYILALPGPSKSPLYLAVGLAAHVYPSASTTRLTAVVAVDGVDVGTAESGSDSGPNGDVWYVRLNASNVARTSIQVTITTSAPLIAALWVYSVDANASNARTTAHSHVSTPSMSTTLKKVPTKELSIQSLHRGTPPRLGHADSSTESTPHVCSAATGEDNKGSTCPTMHVCDSTVSTQLFARGEGDKLGRRDLSFIDGQGESLAWFCTAALRTAQSLIQVMAARSSKLLCLHCCVQRSTAHPNT